MKKILIVEDDQMLRETIVEILSSADEYEIYEAENGDEGIQLGKAESFDLVITDILMPHKDGLEVIMHFRKESPTTKIIAISGGGRVMANDYLNIAEKFGCNESIVKPFDNKELTEKVTRLLAE